MMHPPDLRPTVSAVSASRLTAGKGNPLVLLHTASAFAVSGQRRIPIRLFLDSGSSTTFVRPSLIEALGECNPISSARMSFTTFTDERALLLRRFRISLQSVHNTARVDIMAYEFDFRADPAPQCSDRDRRIIEKFASEHILADTALAQGISGSPISLLIGRDQYFKIAHVGQEKTLEGELVARGSMLGWIVGGATETTDVRRPEFVRANVHCCVASVTQNAKELERLWSLEAIGIEKEESSPFSADEQDAIHQFRDTLVYDGSQYTVAVPKRPGIEDLPCNFQAALDRLQHKLRGLRRRPDDYARYHQEITAFIEQGHAELVEEFPPTIALSGLCRMRHRYFMPHHSVITRVDKGEKWRIVFDCSSAARGCRSLNSYLLVGPNLNPEIVKVLLNFRLHAVAVSADIARAYLCINVAERDRPLFQFLWQGPGDSVITCYQMRKVTWGATPSGYLLAAVLREHFKLIDPDSSLRLGDSFYHDDMLCSFPTVDDARKFIDFIREKLQTAGMQLAKWKTNSGVLADHLTCLGVREAALNLASGKLLKVLGVQWRPMEDVFQFDVQHVLDQVRSGRLTTKRLVLKLVASLYDPLGWVQPFLIRGKLLLRKLWSQSLNWDDAIDEELRSEAGQWGSEVADLSVIRVPRCFGARSVPCTERHLHVFGDASPLAYAAVAYLQSFFADGSSTTSLVMSKTRVAPREKVSLPRLELMAAVLAVRLRIYVVQQLAVSVSRVAYYTDSMITYHWCTSSSTGRWKVFVANRVAEIQGVSTASEWFHLPGDQNVADIATRGISARELHRERRWWNGPARLALPESERPISQPGRTASPPLDAVQDELRSVISTPVVHTGPSRIIDVERFGTLGGALRAVACVFEAIRRMRRRPLLDPADARREGLLHLITSVQREFFPAEIRAAVAGEIPTRRSKLSGFRLFLDGDGLMRVRTRLSESSLLTDEEKKPIVIPGESHLATLLILEEHRTNAHLGVSTILASLRRHYWITRGRQRIKAILARCVTCRKQHGRTLRVVEAPLPASRISDVVPFRTCGLDFCGPFYTRRYDAKEKCNVREKSYVALFTCSTVRAVHLELVPSMKTSQTHLAIRRFLSAQPECVELVTDNAGSFTRAATDIKRVFNTVKDPAVRALLAERGLKWTFICPRAAWHAGFYERLVGTVKAALKRTLGKSFITFEELRTVLSEVAAAVNSRPISYVSDNPDEWTPITPANFLRGGALQKPLCEVVPLDEPNRSSLTRKIAERTTYYRSLVNRWKADYITQLRSANKTAGNGEPVIKKDDVCLFQDDQKPRAKWDLVRVIEAHVGRDEKIRTYTVKFANGFVTRRAAQQLCPLEVA